MECDRYQLLLIEIACAEPPAPALAEARLHAGTCPSCGPQLRKLEQGRLLAASLALVDPSPRVSDRVMQRARAHVSAVDALDAKASRERQAAQSLPDRIREFLIQFAMGRQVAMATVMVLVVAVGLWFVPKARQHELAGGNIVNPDPEGEAGPSDGIVPAAPLDLDLRQGRIRTRGESPEPTSAKEIAAASSPAPTVDEGATTVVPEEPAAEKAAVAVATTAEPDNSAPGANDDRLAGDLESATLAEAAEMERKGRSRAQSAEVAAPMHEELAAGPEAFAQAAPTASAPAAPARRSAARDMSADNPYGGFAPPPAAAPASAPATVSNREATAGGGTANLGESLAADTATSEARKEADALALARDAQRRGRCAEAVIHYERFLRAAPRNRAAMLEAAACYRQLGRQEDASRWTTRASAIAASTAPKSAVRKTEPTVPATAQ